MGVDGTMEYISDLLKKRKKKKKKQMQTVALRVARIDCEGCERKIKHILSGVKGMYLHICMVQHGSMFTSIYLCKTNHHDPMVDINSPCWYRSWH